MAMDRTLLLGLEADINKAVTTEDHATALVAAAERGEIKVVSLLLDRGADVNIVATGGEYGTALIAAIACRRKDAISLLLDRGADVNTIATTGKYGTALIAAIGTFQWNKDVISLLLDRGADANMVATTGKYGTALIAAIVCGRKDAISLLLDRGADVNTIATVGKYRTALIAAICYGRIAAESLQLLLDRGADVNIVATGGEYGTALIAAIGLCSGREFQRGRYVISLLLDRGADVNTVATTGKYGTPLIAAIASCRERMDPISMLLGRGADVNTITTVGEFGTALIAAASCGGTAVVSMLLDRGADVNTIARFRDHQVFNTALGAAANRKHQKRMPQLLKKRADVNTIARFRDHQVFITALGAAANRRDQRVMSQLLNQGADVNFIGGTYGTTLGAAISVISENDLNYPLLSYLLDDQGADINAVGCDYGSVLGIAAYHGYQELVRYLLDRGADPFYVGGTRYKTAARCGYATALHAAQSGKAGPELITLLSNRMAERSGQTDCDEPPFPMPYTGPHVVTDNIPTPLPIHSNLDHSLKISLGTILSAEQADLPCRAFKEEVLVSTLLGLVDIQAVAAKRLDSWIQNDVGYFILQGYDLGLAYAAARVAWKHFNEPNFNVAAHRAQWLKRSKEVEEGREKSIYQDPTTKQELIKLPYEVMPRRIWDVKSNRVVEFRMLYSEALVGQDKDSTTAVPAYWAITHSWTSIMVAVETSVNQYQWPVPLPPRLDLERDLRKELQLLGLGSMYVWLDVLCLRQHSKNPSAVLQVPPDTLNATKEEEWKVDVPTIGNIYRAAQGLVRYFNGLGQAFAHEGWDSDRHWLKRAWTLQEIRSEQRTINGGTLRYDGSSQIIMNAQSTVKGNTTTLRSVMRPVLKLAAVVDSSGGCSIYELAREMAKRHATEPTDKVAGLLYLLRTRELPTYNGKVKAEAAWTHCFDVLPFGPKIEILFDFPYRATSQRWFPTWSQFLDWPETHPDIDYSPTVLPLNRRQLDLEENPERGGLGLEEDPERGGLGNVFLSDIWALSHIFIRSVNGEYEVKINNRVFGFYGPYASQTPIQTTPNQKYTIATAEFGYSNNWVVCEVVKKQKMNCKQPDREETLEVEVEILKKIGVLRTDSGGELWLAGMSGDSVFGKINALFV